MQHMSWKQLAGVSLCRQCCAALPPQLLLRAAATVRSCWLGGTAWHHVSVPSCCGAHCSCGWVFCVGSCAGVCFMLHQQLSKLLCVRVRLVLAPTAVQVLLAAHGGLLEALLALHDHTRLFNIFNATSVGLLGLCWPVGNILALLAPCATCKRLPWELGNQLSLLM